MSFPDDFHSVTGLKPDQQPQCDRRRFLQGGVAAGFAAAALPIAAQTLIRTDAEGLLAGRVQIDAGDRSIPVYRAQPQGGSNLPVVLVVSEIFGLHEHIEDVARRFAKQGYLALAPELFIRQGDAASYPSIAELMSKLIAKVPDQQVIADLDSVLRWAGQHGGDLQRAAITGFCWGGRISWLYAAHRPDLRAAVAWYGRLVGEHTELTPQQPVDIAAGLKVPVLGLYGGKDGGIPQTSIAQMQAELQHGSSGSEFKVYADAGHAFHADYRPSYLASAASDGWQRCLQWFQQHAVK